MLKKLKVMSDQEKQTKQSTPPPLLLMGASQGLTLDPPQGGNLLFPVPQSESSVFPAGLFPMSRILQYCTASRHNLAAGIIWPALI